MQGHVALAHRFRVLIGPSRAVPGGEASRRIGALLPIRLDMTVRRLQSRQQRRRGHAGAQAENPVRLHCLAAADQSGSPALSQDFGWIANGVPHVVPADAAVLIAGEEEHLRSKVCQKFDFLLQTRVRADHGNPLAPVQLPVAGSAIADALPQQAALAGDFPAVGHAGGKDDGSAVIHFVVDHGGIISTHVINRIDPFFPDFDTQPVNLAQEDIAHFRPGDCRKPRIIHDALGFGNLWAQHPGAKPEEIQVPCFCAQCGGNAGGSAADNKQIVHMAHPSQNFSECNHIIFFGKINTICLFRPGYGLFCTNADTLPFFAGTGMRGTEL